MRFSPELIKELKLLLKERCGAEFTDEETQIAGIAIVRFLIVKHQRVNELISNKGNVYGKISSENFKST